MIIEIREQAHEDLQLGFRFYEEQSPGLGRHFLECLFVVRRQLIAANPFADVPCGPQVNDKRIVYVPAETVEHHPGRGLRLVPIFEALRPHLERAYRERAPGAIYVLTSLRHCTNLGTEARRIVKQAGFKMWPKFFTNMRGSCSDDLEREGYPEKTIDGWIGNTARVRRKHYHGNRAEDWATATGKAAPKAAPPTPVSGHQEPSTLHDAREKSLDVVKDAENQYPRQGSNL